MAWPLLSKSSVPDLSKTWVLGTGTCFDLAAFLALLDGEAEQDTSQVFFPFPLGAMVECKKSEEKHRAVECSVSCREYKCHQCGGKEGKGCLCVCNQGRLSSDSFIHMPMAQ